MTDLGGFAMKIGYTFRKFIYSAAAALLCALISVICFVFASETEKNASAMVYFVNTSDEESDETYMYRSVSALRSVVTDVTMLEEISRYTGLSIIELTEILSVAQIEGTYAAEIILSGLEDASEAPLILGAVMNFTLKNPDVPDFYIVSYCDINRMTAFPYIEVSAAIGIMSGIVLYLFTGTSRKKYHYEEKKHVQPHESEERTEILDFQRLALERTEQLGSVDYYASDGLEKSGYAAAVRKIISGTSSESGRIIAAAPVRRAKFQGEIPVDAKFIAYAACAAAADGKRAAVIECNLKNPCVSKLFGKSGAGGISDIAAGNCTIWDAFASEARKGVDIISEKQPYPAPAAVFTSPSFAQLLSYIAGQYDIVFLRTPEAWRCDEWSLIERCCTGIVLITENGLPISQKCAQGILGTKGKYMAVCNVTTPVRDDSEEITKG